MKTLILIPLVSLLSMGGVQKLQAAAPNNVPGAPGPGIIKTVIFKIGSLRSNNTLNFKPAAAGIVSHLYGGNGGDGFDPEFVRSIDVRTGNKVDQITINGHQHGGDGGDDRGALVLGDDEYISAFSIRSGNVVDNVQFTTNLGRSTGGGGDGGDPVSASGIRVISIGGRSGDKVDQLVVTYVEGYQVSKLVEENATFVIGFTPPGTQNVKYQDTRARKLDTYEKITESMMSEHYSASMAAEYYAKVSVSTDIEYKNTNTTTVKQELENELRSGSKTTLTLDADHVGVITVTGNIMQGSNGEYWMVPSGPGVEQYLVIKLSDYNKVLNMYDLTRQLDGQMDNLKEHATNKYRYKFYKM